MFSAEFWDELQSDWIVMDYHTTAMTVKYKQDRVFPQITDGWNEMKEAFDFKDHQLITLFYHGNNLFGLKAIQEIDRFLRVPIYHSRATTPGYTAHFRLQLTNDIINKPCLVQFHIITIFLSILLQVLFLLI
jgi:hypothetical protein